MSRRIRRAICWIRRDLRLSDHAALAAACDAAEEVALLFIFDRVILDALEDRDDRRVTFIHQSLVELDERLRELGSRLVVREGNPVTVVPALAEEWGAEAVFTNRDVDPYALNRDRAVSDALESAGRELRTFKDTVVFESGEILSQAGEPFRVFTPYSKAWRARLETGDHLPRHEPDLARFAKSPPQGELGDLAELGFERGDLWLEPGERAARERLDRFLERIDRYGEERDLFGIDGTSGMSVHFRFGTLSIREAVRAARRAGTPGADKWLSELIWREFYHDILGNFPQVVETTFQPLLADLIWPGDMSHWPAWCEGQTGYPIVDAAMRCLNATGWMHNRLRMVVAMFLTKDLLLDYRLGEAYFARKLLDFDLAQNNGGWQWSASTGADAQPYFRVFNPYLQSRKFDPEAKFIAEWVPELAGLTPELRHCPSDASTMELLAAGIELGKDYPPPIVDHAAQKERAIALFRR